jgi:hypothetical protein
MFTATMTLVGISVDIFNSHPAYRNAFVKAIANQCNVEEAFVIITGTAAATTTTAAARRRLAGRRLAGRRLADGVRIEYTVGAATTDAADQARAKIIAISTTDQTAFADSFTAKFEEEKAAAEAAGDTVAPLPAISFTAETPSAVMAVPGASDPLGGVGGGNGGAKLMIPAGAIAVCMVDVPFLKPMLSSAYAIECLCYLSSAYAIECLCYLSSTYAIECLCYRVPSSNYAHTHTQRLFRSLASHHLTSQAIVLSTAVLTGLFIYCMMIRSHRKEEREAAEAAQNEIEHREKAERQNYDGSTKGGGAGSGGGGKSQKGRYTPAGVYDEDVQRAVNSKPVNFGAELAQEQ